MTDLLTRAAVLRLRDRGYTVLPPGQPVSPTLADMRTQLRAAGHWVMPDFDSMLRAVRSSGYLVIPVGSTPEPELGCYVPTDPRHSKSPARWLRKVLGDQVVYALAADALEQRTVAVGTWHRWVRLTRAVRRDLERTQEAAERPDPFGWCDTAGRADGASGMIAEQPTPRERLGVNRSCADYLRSIGEAAPRQCQACGLGPCRNVLDWNAMSQNKEANRV